MVFTGAANAGILLVKEREKGEGGVGKQDIFFRQPN